PDTGETVGYPGRAIWVTGEEDVLGQFTRSESDVVLPFSDREGYAGIRVRQDLFPLSGVLRRRETRPRIVPRSRERQARPRTSHARAASRRSCVKPASDACSATRDVTDRPMAVVGHRLPMG